MQKTTEHDLYGIWKLLQYKEGNQYGFDLATIERNYGVLTNDPEVTKLVSNVKAYRITNDSEEDNEYESLAKALFFLRTAGKGSGSISFDIDREELKVYFNALMESIERGEVQIDGKREFSYQKKAFEAHLSLKLREGYSPHNMSFSYSPELSPLEFGFLAILFLFEKKGLIEIQELEAEEDKYQLKYGIGDGLVKMLANFNNPLPKECPIKMDESGSLMINNIMSGQLNIGTFQYKYLKFLLDEYPKPVSYQRMVVAITSELNAEKMNHSQMSLFCSQQKKGLPKGYRKYIVHSGREIVIHDN